jgi:2'-5' RNA ligase
MRLFAAVRPPDNALDHLSAALASALNPRADRSSPLQPRANWHVTLAFYGEVPDAAAPGIAANLATGVAGAGRFEVELRGAGAFRRKVGWIGVGGDVAALDRLSRAAAGAWPAAGAGAEGNHGAGPQTRVPARGDSRRPHLTVSRAADRPGTAAALRALSVYVGPSWLVGEVLLLRSELGQGPGRHARYTRLAEIPLAAASTPRPADPRAPR